MTDPTNTQLPMISGTPSVDQTLSCSPGLWTPTPTRYEYQWKRETAPGSGIYANASGQTSPSYRCIAGDIGLRLECDVAATIDALYGALLPARLTESAGAVVNVSTLAGLSSALASAPVGSRINVTASINGGGGTLTVTRAAAFAAPITVTCNPGVTVTNLFIYVKGAYLRFRDLELSGSPIDGIKFTDGAHNCEVDHCDIHGAVKMGVNVQPGAGDPFDIQIWNNRIRSNGTSTTLDHGIYFGIARGNCVVANNLLYDNKAYNIQLYPDPPGIIAACNTLDGGATRGGMVVGSNTGLADNVIVVGQIGTNAAYYCIDIYDPASGDTGNNGYDSLGFGNGLGDFHAGGGFTYTNCSHADPLYVNDAIKDYHLQGGSPAIGKIQAARYGYVPPLDRDGNPRVTADAGCYAA